MSEPQDRQLEMFGPRPVAEQARADLELPGTALELISAIGFDATMKLVEAMPGYDFRVPAKLGDGLISDLLVEAIGHDAAEALIKWGKGSTLYVPACKKALLAKRDREIIRRIESGEHIFRVCQEFKLTRRHLQRVLKRPL
jgi:hypothetical protein